MTGPSGGAPAEAGTPPIIESGAFDAATAAVAAALAAGARYADARLVDRRHESMTARDGELRTLARNTSAGLGVRALVGSSWGFAALGDPSGDADARRTGERATAIARASAAVAGPPMELVPVPPSSGGWASECAEDPFAVPLSEKGDLLTGPIWRRSPRARWPLARRPARLVGQTPDRVAVPALRLARWNVTGNATG